MAARVAGKPLALKIGVADRLLAPGDEKYLVIDNVAVPTITRRSMWHWKLALR